MTSPAERVSAPVDLEGVWARVRDALRERIGEHNLTAWIVPLRCAWVDGRLVLQAPDRVSRDRVARHFLAAIGESLAEALGWPCVVDVECRPTAPALPLRGIRPSREHTFDTFVVGDSNVEAATQARALVSSSAGASLFVHGPSGVGKTHLLHSTFHALDARGLPVLCLPAAQLVTALVAATEAHRDQTFWRDLEPVRALLLDDVHSLAGQDRTQERLMEGLLAWHDRGGLLVLTSDRPPGDLPVLATRVRGSVVAIEPPEPALRVAILERKARALDLVLDPRLAMRIAADIGGNVRRLEGALTRLLAHARLLGRRLDETLALEVLAELRPRLPPALTVDRILEETATAFGALTRSLRGRSRRPELALPRQVAMFLARKLIQRPFAELATGFARDHTTVLHAWRVVSARLGTDRALAAIVEQIEQRLTGGRR